MCTKQHAKWKRMAEFAKSEKKKAEYMEMSNLWLSKQEALVSLWGIQSSDSKIPKKDQ